MVVGIVHKNGILMLDSEQYFSERGHALRESIFLAGRRRLRPILMTALAIAVVGGVAISMLLSLLITPVLFCWLCGKGL